MILRCCKNDEGCSFEGDTDLEVSSYWLLYGNNSEKQGEGKMNNATRKIDKTLTNWREWCKDLGIDLSKIDNMNSESIQKVEKQVEKIQLLLNQKGYDSACFKNLKKSARGKKEVKDAPQDSNIGNKSEMQGKDK